MASRRASTRKNYRKASRKASRKSTRKASRKSTRKAHRKTHRKASRKTHRMFYGGFAPFESFDDPMAPPPMAPTTAMSSEFGSPTDKLAASRVSSVRESTRTFQLAKRK
jgi:hypothetical protein